MSLSPRIQPIFSIIDGQTFTIEDLTGLYNAINNTGGYGPPNISINSVFATRFIFSSYLTELAGTTSTTITAGYEYTVSGASLVYDTKTYLSGSTFISQLSGTPSLGSATLTLTGRFSPVLGFLPPQTTTDPVSPSLVGINDTIFPDSTYTAVYQIFTTKYAAGVLRPAGTYIVINDTVTVGASTYRIGETFTQASTFTTSGSGSIVLYNTEVSRDFQLSYYANYWLETLALRIASSCGCPDHLSTAYLQANIKYDAVLDNFKRNLGQSPSLVQSLLEDISNDIQTALNCP
jgi:hypothetical protein